MATVPEQAYPAMSVLMVSKQFPALDDVRKMEVSALDFATMKSIDGRIATGMLHVARIRDDDSCSAVILECDIRY